MIPAKDTETLRTRLRQAQRRKEELIEIWREGQKRRRFGPEPLYSLGYRHAVQQFAVFDLLDLVASLAQQLAQAKPAADALSAPPLDRLAVQAVYDLMEHADKMPGDREPLVPWIDEQTALKAAADTAVRKAQEARVSAPPQRTEHLVECAMCRTMKSIPTGTVCAQCITVQPQRTEETPLESKVRGDLFQEQAESLREQLAAAQQEIATLRADLQGARADVDQFIRAVDAIRKGSDGSIR